MALKNINIFGANTVYDYHVTKKLFEDYQSGRKFSIGKTYSDHQKTNVDFYNMLQLPIFKSINILQTQKYLCTDRECILIKNGLPLYYDSNHLTLAGSDLLIPLFGMIAEEVYQ